MGSGWYYADFNQPRWQLTYPDGRVQVFVIESAYLRARERLDWEIRYTGDWDRYMGRSMVAHSCVAGEISNMQKVRLVYLEKVNKFKYNSLQCTPLS